MTTKVLNERLPGSLPAAVTNYYNPSLTVSQPVRPISTLHCLSVRERERERERDINKYKPQIPRTTWLRFINI